MFQSALRSGERSDTTAQMCAVCEACFNPRSARVSGATLCLRDQSRFAHCFNPRSARVSGATYVLITAISVRLFQSALRSGERSDWH